MFFQKLYLHSSTPFNHKTAEQYVDSNITYILSREPPPSPTTTITTTSTTAHKLALQHAVHTSLEDLPLLRDGLIAHAELVVYEVRACSLAGHGVGGGLGLARCAGGGACVVSSELRFVIQCE